MIYIPISFLNKETNEVNEVYRGYFTKEKYADLFLSVHKEYDAVIVFENADDEIENPQQCVNV